MDSHGRSNGGGQPDPTEALQLYAEEVAAFSREEAERLTGGLMREQELQAKIKSLLEESQQRERGMRKAVEALTGTNAKPGPKQGAGSGKGWTISQAKVQEVWDAMRARGGEFQPTELRQEYGLSGEAVRRAIEVLRGQELIRVTAHTRGGGRRYALMPGAQEHETIVLERS